MINDETSMDALMHTWCFYDLQVFDLIIYKCLIIRLPDYMYLYSRYYIYIGVLLFYFKPNNRSIRYNTRPNAMPNSLVHCDCICCFKF